MLDKLAKKYSSWLLKKGIINQDERDVQEYGFKALIVHICNFGTLIVLSILFNRFVETCIYLLFYIPVRNIIGGWHAKFPGICWMIGCFVWGFTMLAAPLFAVPSAVMIFINLFIDLMIALIFRFKINPSKKRFFLGNAAILASFIGTVFLFIFLPELYAYAFFSQVLNLFMLVPCLH